MSNKSTNQIQGIILIIAAILMFVGFNPGNIAAIAVAVIGIWNLLRK